MDFAPSPEQAAIVAGVREFVEREMIPVEKEAMANDSLSRERFLEVSRKARQTPYFGPDVPKEVGGQGFPDTTTLLIEMELLRAFIPGLQVLLLMGIGFMKGVALLMEGTDEQKRRYLYPTLNDEREGSFALTEPDAGSDATTISTVAVRDGDEWVINGTKTLVNRGTTSDYAMVFCVTDQEKRARGGISCILVDKGTPGFTVSRKIKTIVPADLAEYRFENCRVPAAALLGPEGQGFQLGMRWISVERLYAGAYCVGRGTRLVEEATRYVEERQAFGQPLIERQAIQWMIADSLVDIYTTKWATLHAGWKSDQGEEVRTEAALVKTIGAQAVNRIADRMVQLWGGYGVTEDSPAAMVFRDARMQRLVDGTDEIQKITMIRGLRRGWRP